jgi:IS30 family transposase
MTLASMKQQGCSVGTMARALGREPSTVSRQGARLSPKLDACSVMWDVVQILLGWKWSPQQIAAMLERVFPDEPKRHVSHETIYTTIYAQQRSELRRASSFACARVTTRACRAPGARTGEARFPRW